MNVVENLRYLCPNGHTQTDTRGVKNISKEGRKRLSEGGRGWTHSREKNGPIVYLSLIHI